MTSTNEKLTRCGDCGAPVIEGICATQGLSELLRRWTERHAAVASGEQRPLMEARPRTYTVAFDGAYNTRAAPLEAGSRGPGEVPPGWNVVRNLEVRLAHAEEAIRELQREAALRDAEAHASAREARQRELRVEIEDSPELRAIKHSARWDVAVQAAQGAFAMCWLYQQRDLEESKHAARVAEMRRHARGQAEAAVAMALGLNPSQAAPLAELALLVMSDPPEPKQK